MIFSATAEYALRAVIMIADHAGSDAVSGSEVAQALEAPPNYMSKIMHRLARAGILVSTRGKGGGFRLAHPASEISLIEVVSVFDTVNEGRTCLLGRPECTDSNPCPLHTRWKPMAEAFATLIRQTTLADLLPQAASSSLSEFVLTDRRNAGG